jgi:hypothetical protein
MSKWLENAVLFAEYGPVYGKGSFIEKDGLGYIGDIVLTSRNTEIFKKSCMEGYNEISIVQDGTSYTFLRTNEDVYEIRLKLAVRPFFFCG